MRTDSGSSLQYDPSAPPPPPQQTMRQLSYVADAVPHTIAHMPASDPAAAEALQALANTVASAPPEVCLGSLLAWLCCCSVQCCAFAGLAGQLEGINIPFMWHE